MSKAPVLQLAVSESPAAEAFAALRTELDHASPAEVLRVILITSATQDNGKSTVSVNLALSASSAGLRSLVIDADLRKSAVTRFFGLGNHPGLSTSLAAKALRPLSDVVVVPPGMGGAGEFAVMPSGPLPPSTANLLASSRLPQLITRLLGRYDCVFIDAPPVLAVADTTILARSADGVLLVVDLKKARRREIRSAVDNLQRAHATILGLVLNRVRGIPGYQLYGYSGTGT